MHEDVCEKRNSCFDTRHFKSKKKPVQIDNGLVLHWMTMVCGDVKYELQAPGKGNALSTVNV